MGSNTMEIIIEKIRRTSTTNNIILSSSIPAYATTFEYDWDTILNLSQYYDRHMQINGKVIIASIFHGPISFGHWFLTIIDYTGNPGNGYIIDSLGYSQERYMYVCDIFEKNITWKQHQMEHSRDKQSSRIRMRPEDSISHVWLPWTAG